MLVTYENIKNKECLCSQRYYITKGNITNMACFWKCACGPHPPQSLKEKLSVLLMTASILRIWHKTCSEKISVDMELCPSSYSELVAALHCPAFFLTRHIFEEVSWLLGWELVAVVWLLFSPLMPEYSLSLWSSTFLATSMPSLLISVHFNSQNVFIHCVVPRDQCLLRYFCVKKKKRNNTVSFCFIARKTGDNTVHKYQGMDYSDIYLQVKFSNFPSVALIWMCHFRDHMKNRTSENYRWMSKTLVGVAEYLLHLFNLLVLLLGIE